MKRRRLDPITVESGQCYVMRRHRRPVVKIKIVRVVRYSTKTGDQPKAYYVRLDADNRPARKGNSWEPGPTGVARKGMHYQTTATWLTWRDGAWRFPHASAELVPCD